MAFKKGQSGNLNGRPKGSKNTFTIDSFRQAIRNVEEKDQVNILEHFIRRALASDTVLIALMNKVMHNHVVMETEIIDIDFTSKNDWEGT